MFRNPIGIDQNAYLLISLILGSAVFFRLAPAEACSCSPPTAEFMSSPSFIHDEPFELLEENIELSCHGRDDSVTCTFRGHYRIRNLDDRHISTQALIIGSPRYELEIEVNGQPAHIASNDEFQPAREAFLEEAEEMHLRLGSQASTAFSLDIEAQGEVTVDVSGAFEPSPWTCGCSFPTIQRRHIFVNRGPFHEYFFRYLFGFGLSRPSDLVTSYTFERPSRWINPGRRSRRHWDARNRRRGRLRLSKSSQEELNLQFTTQNRVQRGGPFIGGGVGVDEEAQGRFRAGWEFSVLKLMIFSLAIEYETLSTVEFVPSFDITFPNGHVGLVMVVPTPSLGLGALVQVYPERRAGIRASLTFAWHVFSLIGAFDFLPDTRTQERVYRGSVFIQFGF